MQQGLVIHALLLLLVTTTTADLLGRCGECWCIPGNDGRDECPSGEETIGITDKFNLEDSILWGTFKLTNAADASFLTLNGDGCYPFANKLAAEIDDLYTEAEGPQCALPTAPDTAVCAFNFTEVEVCADRPYEIITFDSRQAAEDAGAIVTHEGACGVCSSASDLWAMIKNYETFERDAVFCATSFVFGGALDPAGRFEKLVNCIMDLGYSEPCSTLWAHSAATSGLKCGGVCVTDDATDQTVLNGPAPACEIADCLQCSDVYQADFDALAGRTLYNSGFTERIARSCDVFAKIIHDPCVMAMERGEVVTDPPVEAPSSDNSGANMVASFWAVAAAAVGSFVLSY